MKISNQFSNVKYGVNSNRFSNGGAVTDFKCRFDK